MKYKTPTRGVVEPIQMGPNTLVYRVKKLDMSLIGNGFTVPTDGYNVASFQIIDSGSAALSTGTLSAMACNDTESTTVAHPSGVSRSAAGLSTSFPLETALIGLEVTVIQASVFVDAYLVLRK